MMRIIQILSAALSTTLVGCSPPQAESPSFVPIIEDDLVGLWELKYDGKTIFDKASGTSIYGNGIEKITFLPNGRYEQEFDDGIGGSYPKTESTWELAKKSSGRQVVILYGLRNYKYGVAAATVSPPPQSTSLLIEVATSVPFSKVKQLILCFDETDLNLCFKCYEPNVCHEDSTKTK